jgi:bifunctional N-acetylglucosamine-1-phosphate-uridyltransferase/glucosamine-1-phosphate-acetyltransferase GlmU-like protein
MGTIGSNVNEILILSVGNVATIPPGTTIYLNVTTAAVATTYNVRISLWGCYR